MFYEGAGGGVGWGGDGVQFMKIVLSAACCSYVKVIFKVFIALTATNVSLAVLFDYQALAVDAIDQLSTTCTRTLQ